MEAKINKRVVDQLTASEYPFEVVDTELKGFLIRVQPSGRMTYYYSYRSVSQGRRNRIKLGTTEELSPVQARDLARQTAGKVAAGQDPAHEKRLNKSRNTLESFIENDYAPWVANSRRTGDETIKRIKYSFPDLLKKNIQDITARDVERWITSRLKDGSQKSTINRDVTALKGALSKAVQWGILDKSPFANLSPLKVDEGTRIRFLSEDERSRLHAQLEKRDKGLLAIVHQRRKELDSKGITTHMLPDSMHFGDHLTPMVLISLNTGLRRSEVFSLTWENIDFQKKFLTVPASNVKTAKTQHTPMNAAVQEVLQLWQEQTGKTTGLVFKQVDGSKFTQIRRPFENVVKKAGIEDFHWHDMRHDFASQLVMRGVDLYTVKELLGHSTIKMTEKYAHLAPEHKAAAVAVLDQPRNVVPFKQTEAQ